jgi:hypothetical protein
LVGEQGKYLFASKQIGLSECQRYLGTCGDAAMAVQAFILRLLGHVVPGFRVRGARQEEVHEEQLGQQGQGEHQGSEAHGQSAWDRRYQLHWS